MNDPTNLSAPSVSFLVVDTTSALRSIYHRIIIIIIIIIQIASSIIAAQLLTVLYCILGV
jgi:hypothetical protein